MKKTWFGLLATFAYNTAIAGLLTLLSAKESFSLNFIFSQCIGFSIALINAPIWVRMQPGIMRWAVLCVMLPASIAIGVTLAFRFTGVGDWSQSYALNSVLIGLFFGIIASITFVLFERIKRLDNEIKQRQLSQIESEKREMEAQLKMLQAQIEPHFLFNTLANVGSLIDSDPALSKRLLERLNEWLRLALQRARSGNTNLGDELDMLENYLQILKIRFGDRLRWSMDMSDNARASPFPPMLLQPLVENAVQHGIEPKLGGGMIRIHAVIVQDKLRIEVHDDCVGLNTASGTGTGITNVHARLFALYGGAGKLTLKNNAQENNTCGGVTATLELPLLELSS